MLVLYLIAPDAWTYLKFICVFHLVHLVHLEQQQLLKLKAPSSWKTLFKRLNWAAAGDEPTQGRSPEWVHATKPTEHWTRRPCTYSMINLRLKMAQKPTDKPTTLVWARPWLCVLLYHWWNEPLSHLFHLSEVVLQWHHFSAGPERDKTAAEGAEQRLQGPGVKRLMRSPHPDVLDSSETPAASRHCNYSTKWSFHFSPGADQGPEFQSL